jgi:hypothetical protein
MKIVVQSKNEKHTRLIVFANGANCGHLCMNNDEAYDFVNALKLGSELASISVQVDDNEGTLLSPDGEPYGTVR